VRPVPGPDRNRSFPTDGSGRAGTPPNFRRATVRSAVAQSWHSTNNWVQNGIRNPNWRPETGLITDGIDPTSKLYRWPRFEPAAASSRRRQRHFARGRITFLSAWQPTQVTFHSSGRGARVARRHSFEFFRHSRQRGLDLRAHLTTVELCGALARDDDHSAAGTQHRLQGAAETFAQAPFGSIADNSVANPPRNREPQPRGVLIGKPCQVHNKVRGLISDSQPAHTQKVGAPPQAMLFAKARLRLKRYPGCLGGIEIARRRRPLLRRRLSTRRPPGDAIRARNPWVRFRRRLLG
jgi:hypothetical protein